MHPWEIAVAVRAELEQVNDVLRIWPDNFCGGCITGTQLLHKRLGGQRWLGKSKDKPGCSHAWLETDHWLLDLTFTQFENEAPKVLAIHKTSQEYLAYRDRFEATPINPYTFFDWPPDQNPQIVLTRYIIQRCFDRIQSWFFPLRFWTNS